MKSVKNNLLVLMLVLNATTSLAGNGDVESARKLAEMAASSSSNFMNNDGRAGNNCKAATKAVGRVLLNISNGYGVQAGLEGEITSTEVSSNQFVVALNMDREELEAKAVYTMTVERNAQACVIKSIVQQ